MLALDGVNEKSLQRCTEAERLENKEVLESNAANLAVASVQSHRAEVGGFTGGRCCCCCLMRRSKKVFGVFSFLMFQR